MKSDSDSSHINPSLYRGYNGQSYSDKSYSGAYPISYNSIGGTGGANTGYNKLY